MATANNFSEQSEFKHRSYANLISVLKTIQSFALLGSTIIGLLGASVHLGIGLIAFITSALTVYVSTQSFIAIIDLLSQIEHNTRTIDFLKDIEYNTRFYEPNSSNY